VVIRSFEVTVRDVVQDAMVSVWKRASAFDFERESVSPWILRIVVNRASSEEKKSRSERAKMVEAGRTETCRSVEHPPPVSERAELLAALREIMARLPKTDRQLVALCFGAGVSQAEADRVLSVSQQTISARLRKLLERVRFQLGQAGLPAVESTLLPAAIAEVAHPARS
jgi:RNA polymerase sigma-70 factor (ECF subfamily)